MDAIKYMKKLRKMCNYYSERKCCEMCPLFQINGLCAKPNEMTKIDMRLSVDVVNRWNRSQDSEV